jgi:hypothetical protein
MSRRIKSCILILLISLLGFTNSAMAAEITLSQGGVVKDTTSPNPGLDDESYKLDGVTIVFDGVTYTDVYISENSVLSFGDAYSSYDDWPDDSTPMIALYHDDYYINGTADSKVVAELDGSTLTITLIVVPCCTDQSTEYIENRITITGVNTGSSDNFSINYTVNGLPGPDLLVDNDTELWSAIQRSSGEIVGVYTFNPVSIRRGIAPSSIIRSSKAPLASIEGSKVSCAPGEFTSGSGAVSPSTVAYTLVVNGAPYARAVSDAYASIPASFYDSFAAKGTGSATLSGATFDIAGLSDYSVSCTVEAFAGATRVLTQSKEVMDSVMTAKLAKAEAEAEAARRAALAEFNSKANRDLRKRLAARGIGG